ncbi:MAG: lipocalin-like domain-containing protein [Gammaproteobacteria bacterium]
MKRLLILACCLFTNPLLAAHSPATDGLSDDVRLVSVDGPGYSGDPALPNYRTEWWYLSANLADREGRLWELEWTLYRQAPGPQAVGDRGRDSSMMLAHASITTPGGAYHEQRFTGGGGLQAAGGEKLADGGTSDWQWVSRDAALFPARLSFRIGDRDLNLLLETTGAAIAGKIDSGGRTAARHYASQPQLRVRGFVDRGADKTYLRGAGRFDREWNSPMLADNIAAEDLLSLQADAPVSGANRLAPRHARQSPAD